jgi:hypothetical protein
MMIYGGKYTGGEGEIYRRRGEARETEWEKRKSDD